MNLCYDVENFKKLIDRKRELERMINLIDSKVGEIMVNELITKEKAKEKVHNFLPKKRTWCFFTKKYPERDILQKELDELNDKMKKEDHKQSEILKEKFAGTAFVQFNTNQKYIE